MTEQDTVISYFCKATAHLQHQNIHLSNQNTNLNKRIEQYQLAYQLLQQQIADLRRNRFGKKSERFIAADNPQMSLLDDTPLSAQADKSNDTGTIEVPAHKRKRARKEKDLSDLPRQIEIIPVAEEDRFCGCGKEKKVIRYEKKELLDYQPSRLSVIEQRREVLACSCGQCAPVTAPAPKHILPKVGATESLLAQTVISKLHHRMPLYHQEKYGEIAGFSRETLARWHIALTSQLQPLVNLLRDEVLADTIAGVDATTWQVLKEIGRAPETKSHVYCMRGFHPDKPVVVYDYTAGNDSLFIANWFAGFTGHIHMDASTVSDKLLASPDVVASYCNAHARRYFEKIVKQTKGKKGLAHEALGFYRQLYAIEKKANRDKLIPDERYQLRQTMSKPIMQAFKAWLDKHHSSLLPNSSLEKVFAYAINHWHGLTRFLDNGRLEIDNNLVEQDIKPLVICRKNVMFSDTVPGIKALTVHMSLIRSALANNLIPYRYYVAILKRIPHCETVDDFDALLPWNIKLDSS